MRAAVLGANGRMGQLVLFELGSCCVSAIGRDSATLPAGPWLSRTLDDPDCFADATVLIDFSSPQSLLRAIPLLPPSVALVSGTTGLTAEHLQALQTRAGIAPVLYAPNFSLGVALLLELVSRAAAILPGYDAEIVEVHHKHKRDAPSGTALALAAAIADARGQDLTANLRFGREGLVGERTAGEIAVHAVRAGDVVGDHTVWLAGTGERIELRHVATSRATFASGAVRAAHWLDGRLPGTYQIRDMLGT